MCIAALMAYAMKARDQDPDGRFVRIWLPALERVPVEYIFGPWTIPTTLQAHVGCNIGINYPAPIVGHIEAMRFARDTIHNVKRDAAVKDEARRVYTKHGSRNPQRERATGTVKKRGAARKSDANNVTTQLAFAWDSTEDS